MEARGHSGSSWERTLLVALRKLGALIERVKIDDGVGEDDGGGVDRISALPDQVLEEIVSGEDDGGGVDRISALPDQVLEEIISLLPTFQGCRTQILASRWRCLWRSAPIDLDSGRLGWNAISAILSSHQGPGRRFCIPLFRAEGNEEALDACLRSPALDSLQELELGFSPPVVRPSVLFCLPAAAFRSSSTLRIIQVTRCSCSDAIVQGLHFPKLEQLCLVEVTISERSLNSLIAGCPVVESVVITGCSGFRCLRVNSVFLRRMSFNTYLPYEEKFHELVIQNGPRLEMLLTNELLVSVLFAPKLETIGTRLVFASNDDQGPCICSFTTVVSKVRCLTLTMPTLCLDMVIESLRRFPCLEKLQIQCKTPGPEKLWLRKHQDLIKSLDLPLKKLVLSYGRGIAFFILNARVFESMTLVLETNSEALMIKQRQELQLQNTASSECDARFHVNTVRDPRFTDIKNNRDLDLFDPWE